MKIIHNQYYHYHSYNIIGKDVNSEVYEIMIWAEIHEGVILLSSGQKFQKVENDENRFFAITSSKLFKN